MGKSKTISLTKVPESCHYERLLQRDYDYDEDVVRRLAIKRRYFQQIQTFEEMLHETSISLNAHVIDAVEAFASRSLDLDKTRIFAPHDQMYGATLVLDMQISDHELILSSIEKRLRKLKGTNLCVLRLQSKTMKKKSIAELLESVRQFKRILIMIEQAELLTRGLTEGFVGHLRNQLSDELSPTETIMVIFCLSARVQALPFDQMNCFGRMEDIVKDQDLVQHKIRRDLMRSSGMLVKLGPKPLDLIIEFLLNVDASMAGVHYLYTLAIFLHYDRMENKMRLAERDFDKLEKFESEHQSLMRQLDCYADLLKDYETWPEDSSSLYELLIDYKHLSESEKFVDEINKLKKLSSDVILKKIKRALDNSEVEVGHVSEILKSYQESMSNNEDCSKIVSKMTRELLRHGGEINNPIQSHRSIYFNDVETLSFKGMTSTRGFSKTIGIFANPTTYFGIIFRRLMQSTGCVSGDQIFEDAADDFIELIRSERKSGSKLKLSAEDELGLAKALFFDIIDCLEHQQIVKVDNKSKLIRRLAWPTLK